jgi:hypothetical protein
MEVHGQWVRFISVSRKTILVFDVSGMLQVSSKHYWWVFSDSMAQHSGSVHYRLVLEILVETLDWYGP